MLVTGACTILEKSAGGNPPRVIRSSVTTGDVVKVWVLNYDNYSHNFTVDIGIKWPRSVTRESGWRDVPINRDPRVDIQLSGASGRMKRRYSRQSDQDFGWAGKTWRSTATRDSTSQFVRR